MGHSTLSSLFPTVPAPNTQRSANTIPFLSYLSPGNIARGAYTYLSAMSVAQHFRLTQVAGLPLLRYVWSICFCWLLQPIVFGSKFSHLPPPLFLLSACSSHPSLLTYWASVLPPAPRACYALWDSTTRVTSHEDTWFLSLYWNPPRFLVSSSPGTAC